MSSGGAERVISIITNYLIKKDYDITILTWLNCPIFYELNSKIKIINIEKECGSSNIIKKSLFFRKYIKNNKPDLLFSFLAKLNILVLLSCAFTNVKIIVCERNDPRWVPFNKYLRYARNWIYQYAYRILTQTDSNKNYFSEKLRQKTSVIYNPINIQKELVGIATTQPKSRKIVSVGRLVDQKNHDMLIRAFSLFLKDKPDFNLYIYGEGKNLSRLKNLSRELGIDNNVLFPGNKKNIFTEIIDADIFVQTSKFEGMPNTLIEAMCLGLPCISTKVSGATDLIDDGINGYIVEIDDTDQLNDVMLKLANNESLRREIGNNAAKLYDTLKEEVIMNEWECYIREQIKQ